MRIFVLLFALLTATAWGQEPSPENLSAEMGARITRVPEFQFIREEAQKMGLRVYLFGGTAAAYGHYVRQDLAREAGNKNYPDFLFDYDYTNIFRSTQDLDVVVDGSAEQTEKLENIVKAKFPHFLGDKAAGWELRPLRVNRADKDAILGNPNFLNQHTDSHSTGMVEVTQTPKGESAVKDIRDWDSLKPQFLRDVSEQKLHYYFNPLHETTSRAKQGLNPPIISAIRYLTKAFQYDLEIGPEDKKQIQQIVNAFRPAELKNDYLNRWVEKNGKKLFQHAVDLEYAWNTLEELGLRKKLIALRQDVNVKDSLAWWMNKEPLRSKPLGRGTGITAAEIAKKRGLDKIIVSHETNSLLAFESLKRSKAGTLNAFASRPGKIPGENAETEGFYTLIGKSGQRGTGLTVHLEIDPTARDSADFAYEYGGQDYLIVKNRNAVKVIPEQLDISLPEYFRRLAEGKEFSTDDKALLENLKRKLKRAALLAPADKTAVEEIVRAEMKKMPPNEALLQEWFSFPMSAEHPEWVQGLLDQDLGALVAGDILSQPHWSGHPEFVEKLLATGNYDHELTTYVLSQKHWENHPEWVEKLLAKGNLDHDIVIHILSQSQKHPEWVEALVKKGNVDKELAEYVIPLWPDKPEWAKTILARGRADAELAEFVLSQGSWEKNPELLDSLIEKGSVDRQLAESTFSQAHWRNHPEFLLKLIKKDSVGVEIVRHVLSQPYWAENPAPVEALLALGKGKVDRELAQHVLPRWPNKPEWVSLLIQRGLADRDIAQYVLTQDFAKDHPEWAEALVKNGKADAAIGQFLLSHPNWEKHPKLVEAMIAKGTLDPYLVQARLLSDDAQKHPEWLEAFFRNPKIEERILKQVTKGWEQNPWLKAAVGSRKVTVGTLKEIFQAGTTFHVPSPVPANCAQAFKAIE